MEVGDPRPKTQTEKSTDPIWAHLAIRETLNLRAQKDLRTEISVGCASWFDFFDFIKRDYNTTHTIVGIARNLQFSIMRRSFSLATD